ncbi:MAG: hypothetical protein EBR86_14925 [Planctomycetia bacterium]|nr:hypothetical protein [Planctomycetia bacterium]
MTDARRDAVRMATLIGEAISTHVLRGSPGQPLTGIGVTPPAHGGLALGPLRNDLEGGLSGLALLLAALHRATGNPSWEPLARRVIAGPLAELRRWIAVDDEHFRTLHPAWGDGLTGLTYGIAGMHTLLGVARPNEIDAFIAKARRAAPLQGCTAPLLLLTEHPVEGAVPAAPPDGGWPASAWRSRIMGDAWFDALHRGDSAETLARSHLQLLSRVAGAARIEPILLLDDWETYLLDPEFHRGMLDLLLSRTSAVLREGGLFRVWGIAMGLFPSVLVGEGALAWSLLRVGDPQLPSLRYPSSKGRMLAATGMPPLAPSLRCESE